MGNPIIFQALLVLVILFFLFITFMSFKTWKWFHPLLMLCVFGAAICLAGYLAPVVKTHNAWKQKYTELETRLDDTQNEHQRVKYGDPNLVNQAEPPDPNAPLLTTRAVLQRLTLDRGTVWRQCAASPTNSNQVTLTTVPDDKPNHIQVNDVLYAFLESDVNGFAVPTDYIGELKVTAATDNSVTLTPTRVSMLSPRQVNIFQKSQDRTWALYSVMPIDGHEFFATTAPEGNYKLPIFGQMDEAELRQMFPPTPGNAEQTQAQEALIQSFLRDGSKATSSDSPENVWTKVEFIKPYKSTVDSQNVRELETLFYFDPTTGEAEAGNLKVGEQVSFNAGDFAIFDTEFATQLKNEGYVETVDRVYVRELVDFDYSMKNHYRRIKMLEEKKKVVQDETARLMEAIGKVDDMTTFRQGERTKLEEDKAKFVKERDEINSYLAELEEVWNARRKELAGLFSANLKLEQELERVNASLTEQINRRTLEATAQATAPALP